MEVQYTISLIWLAGFGLSYWMLGVEHASQTEVKTNGEQAMQVVLSLLSFIMVIWLMIKAWAHSVKKYWSKPINPKIKA